MSQIYNDSIKKKTLKNQDQKNLCILPVTLYLPLRIQPKT